MSHYWDLHCRTCDSDAGIHQDSHDGGRFLDDVWRHREHALYIAIEADKLRAHEGLSALGSYDCGVAIAGTSLPIKWMVEHRSHDVAACSSEGLFVDGTKCRWRRESEA